MSRFIVTKKALASTTIILLLILFFISVVVIIILTSYPFASNIINSFNNTEEFNIYDVLETSYTNKPHLEILYFLASIFLFSSAAFAIIFAREQSKLANEAAKAQSYIDIAKLYYSNEIAKSREYISTLEYTYCEYEIYRKIHPDLSDFINAKLLDKRKQQASRSCNDQDINYDQCLYFLHLLEFIGVLTRKRYLREEDVFELYLGTLLRTENALKKHIKTRREIDKNTSLYANAITLFEKAKIYKNKVYTYDEKSYEITENADCD